MRDWKVTSLFMSQSWKENGGGSFGKDRRFCKGRTQRQGRFFTLAQQQRASEQQTAIEGDRVAMKRRKNKAIERECVLTRGVQKCRVQ